MDKRLGNNYPLSYGGDRHRATGGHGVLDLDSLWKDNCDRFSFDPWYW